MEYLNNKSIKVLIMLVVCCLLFVICLPFAYKNVPSNDRQSVNSANIAADEIEQQGDYSENTVQESNDNDEENNVNSSESEKISISDRDFDFRKDMEEIDESSDFAVNSVNQEDVFSKAAALKAEKKYESAVYEYEQLAKNSDNAEFKAKCYEEIAIIYGSMKRYGSGLSYAQKAFNVSPSDERELLLARMYYKTGSSAKASDRVNAILKRDFD